MRSRQRVNFHCKRAYLIHFSAIKAYTIFQHPKQVAFMWRDGGWTPALVAEHFDQILGQHLQPVGMVMPTGMALGDTSPK